MSRKKKRAFGSKGVIIGTLGIVGLLVGFLLVSRFLGSSKSGKEATTYQTAKAEEGNLTSAILLSGTIRADEEQYVYYDATKGDLASVAVNVGDQVEVGQVLASYDATEAQRAYDAAVRALNKVDRQIYQLKNTGQVVDANGEVSTASYDSQLKDLNDARADAVDGVNRTYQALQNTNVLSTVNGVVVEVKRNVSKGATDTPQTIVHVVNSGSLVVAGEMSEFNHASVSMDQEVVITSKVYPDQTWTGKVSHISDYPTTPTPAAQASTPASKYPFKVSFTSELGSLKQGFAVTIQINSNSSGILVPLKAVLRDDKGNHYVFAYDDKAKRIKRLEVQLGGADGIHQQIAAGLNAGDLILANPTKDLEDGQEVVINGKKAN